MKIIKHGEFYNETTKTTCMCGCEFEYENKDIIVNTTITLTSNPPQYYKYIKCPECNAIINIGTTQQCNVYYKEE